MKLMIDHLADDFHQPMEGNASQGHIDIVLSGNDVSEPRWFNSAL